MCRKLHDLKYSRTISGLISKIYSNLTINTFVSIREASNKTGVNRRGISWCCLNKPKYKTAGGFKWKFKEE